MPTAFSAEMQLLLRCARAKLSETRRAELGRQLVPELDWSRLLLIARMHGMLPLLYSHLGTLGRGAVPADAQAQMERAFRYNVCRSLQWTNELASIIRSMEERGVVAVPYKGPALAVRLYGHVALREWCDLDLLVRRSDVAAARVLLLARGYRRLHETAGAVEQFVLDRRHSEILVHDEGFSIELHWATTSRSLGRDHHLAGVFDRLVPLSVLGFEVRMLSDADLLLALAAHGGKHLWLRLEWLAGFGALLESMTERADWDGVEALARTTHALRPLLVAVWMSFAAIGGDVPDRLLERARADRTTRQLAVDALSLLQEESPLRRGTDPLGRLTVEWFHFRMLQGVRDRLRFLVHRATTPRRSEDAEVVRLLGRSVPLAALTRPAHLMGKFVHGARQSRERSPGSGSSAGSPAAEKR